MGGNCRHTLHHHLQRRNTLYQNEHDNTSTKKGRRPPLPEETNAQSGKWNEEKLKLEEEPAIEDEPQRNEEETPEECELLWGPTLPSEIAEYAEEPKEEKWPGMQKVEIRRRKTPGRSAGSLEKEREKSPDNIAEKLTVEEYDETQESGTTHKER